MPEAGQFEATHTPFESVYPLLQEQHVVAEHDPYVDGHDVSDLVPEHPVPFEHADVQEILLATHELLQLV
jgi:hypothetical protein